MKLKTSVQDEILSDIETIQKDEKLCQEKNFSLRAQAIDFIEFHVIDRINVLMDSTDAADRMNLLNQYAATVKLHLENTDASMFYRLRKMISQEENKGKLLMDLVEEYLEYNFNTCLQQDATGYDNLDIFLNGLLTNQKMPVETKSREREMIFYQKTPARIIMEVVKKAEFKSHDVFVDLGAGLGHVVILVNLLTSVMSKGIEFEPAFCNYAKACVAELNLTRAEFINMDARYADYSSGTVFFMYTPFEGKMLEEVLQNVENETKRRKIKIFTYGPCTPKVAKQGWLTNGNDMQHWPSQFGEFVSV
ncbi:MAG: hypothetical protein ABJB86_06835 [Bacteroidota bacterium]